MSTADAEPIFSLGGSTPTWIWPYVCRAPNCDCRTALIIATHEGTQVLRERGAPVFEARVGGGPFRELAAEAQGLHVFNLDIDSVEGWTLEHDASDLSEHPELRSIVADISGELLDELGRMWFRGKGLTPPEERLRQMPRIVLPGWRPASLIGWNRLMGLRTDHYEVDGRLYRADEMYCPAADCDCREVIVGFETISPAKSASPGYANVSLTGEVGLYPGPRPALFERLWTAFRNRHPTLLEHAPVRYAAIKEVGTRLELEPPPRAKKVSRNAPCPCGSGRKHKRCCWGR